MHVVTTAGPGARESTAPAGGAPGSYTNPSLRHRPYEQLNQARLEVIRNSQALRSRQLAGQAPKNKFVQGSILKGLRRVVAKALTPRGLLQLALIPVGGVGLIFPVKHFLEGLLGYDSLFFRRRVPAPLSRKLSGVQHQSAWQAWKSRRSLLA